MYGQILVKIVIPKRGVVFEKIVRSLFPQSEMGGVWVFSQHLRLKKLVHCKISIFLQTNLLIFPIFSMKSGPKTMK